MQQEKNKNGVIALLVVIIVILLALVVLLATGTVSFKKESSHSNEKDTNNEQTSIDSNVNSDNGGNENSNNTGNKDWTVYQQCGGVVYYNPVTNKSCNKDDEGCLGWYVISQDKSSDSQLEVILNKNLGDTVALNENNNPAEGPITALNYLKSQTSNWKVIARMLTISDVASILNIEKNEEGHLGVVEVPACLYSNGDSREYWNGGYWLSDYEKGKPVFVIDCSRGLISAGNQFIKSSPTNSTTWGVRPVIKIDKSVLQ